LRMVCVLSAVLAGFAVSLVLADELHLLSGTVFKGRLLSQTDEQIEFEVSDAAGTAVIKIPVNKARGISVDGKYSELGGAAVGAAPGAPAAFVPAKGDARPEAEVEERIEQAAALPDWLDAVKLQHPPTLDLTWARSNGNRDEDLAAYLSGVINPDPARWREGVKLLHQALTLNQADATGYSRTAAELARCYERLLADYARAAHWYRKAGPGHELDLGACYLGLGSRSMAAAELSKAPKDDARRADAIRLWGGLGQSDKAVALAEAMAASGQADAAYLAAGDACRFAGEDAKALGFYRKVLSVTDGTPDMDRNKRLAQSSVEALGRMAGIDLRKVPDGTYPGTAAGQGGPLTVDAVVSRGRIESLKVTRHSESPLHCALTEVPKAVVRSQGVRGVDIATAAATSTGITNALINALADGMKKAPATAPAAKYKDGTYTGSGKGHKGEIAVALTIRDGKIESLNVVRQRDDAKWYQRATAVIGRILAKQDTKGVDVVSGATHSSRGIIDATTQALGKARTGAQP